MMLAIRSAEANTGKAVTAVNDISSPTPAAFGSSSSSHAANIQDRDGAKDVLKAVRARFSRLRHVFADGSYAGDKLKDALEPIGKWSLEIIERFDTTKGFELLRRIWVVERPFASL